MLTTREAVVIGLLGLCACGDLPLSGAGGSVVIEPQAIAFPRTFVGYPTTAQVEVRNIARSPIQIEVVAAPPFALEPASLRLEGGTSAVLAATFAPQLAGPAQAVAHLGEGGESLEVTLAGEGAIPPVCPKAAACHLVTFDPVGGSCADVLSPELSACEGADACLVEGRCVAGECVGVPRDCDDENACTRDVCDPHSGCMHVDAGRECPPPTEACKVATCDPTSGCGIADAADGTSCGPADCRTADVCILGSCRTLPVPEGTPCSPQTPCQGRGYCHHEVCDRPVSQPMAPLWTYTPPAGGQVLFSGTVDTLGQLYFVETLADAGGKLTSAALVSLTRDGFPRYRRELARDGWPGSLMLEPRLDLLLVSTGASHFEARRMSDGELLWERSLGEGLPVVNPDDHGKGSFGAYYPTILGESGLIAFQVVEGYTLHVSYVIAVDSATGATAWTVRKQGHIYGFIADEAGNIYLSSAPCWVMAADPVSIGPDGEERWHQAEQGGPLVVANGLLLGAVDGQLWLQDASSGASLHELSSLQFNWYSADPVLDARSLTVPIRSDGAMTYGAALSSIDLTTGETRWTADLSQPVASSLGEVTLTSRGTLLATTWPTTYGVTTPSLIHEVSPTGKVLYSCELPDRPSQTALQGERLFAAMGTGVAAFEMPGLSPATSGWVTGSASASRDRRAH